MNCGIESNPETHNILLFLITKETEVLGEMIKNEFECDFLLLKFEQPFLEMKYDTQIQQVKTQSVKMQSQFMSASASTYEPYSNMGYND